MGRSYSLLLGGPVGSSVGSPRCNSGSSVTGMDCGPFLILPFWLAGSGLGVSLGTTTLLPSQGLRPHDTLLCLSLLREHIENLFQSSLDNAVLADVKLLLSIFHQTKEVPNRVVVSADLQFPCVSVVLDDFELFEKFLEVVNGLVALAFHKLPF